MRRWVVLCAALLGSLVPLSARGPWGADYFPNVVLTTQDGRTVRFYDDLLKGKIVAVNMIYTSCKYACPLETARLAQVQRLLGDRMGRDVFFYSITIDPEFDTPAVLKSYAENFNAGPGWLFLTGKKSDVELIGRKLGLYNGNDGSADGHAPNLLVGNEATGQWIRNSAVDNPKFLATTIGNWLNSWQTAAKPSKTYAEMPVIKMDAGEYGFKTHCSACHTIGGGNRIGPDLQGITSRRERPWLTRFITVPDQVIAAKDPIALALLKEYKQVPMPALGLATADAELVLDYIAKQQPATREPGPPLTSLIEPYLAIQSALSLDTLTGVAVQARLIGAEASQRGGPAAEIATTAAALATEATDVAAARRAFGAMGDAMIRYANAVNSRPESGIKIAYCPMAGKFWLQRGDTLRNPYYGRAMLDCGRFVPDLPTGPLR